MNISRVIYASLLLCFLGIGYAHSQDKSEGKSKDKKSEQRAVEVKANLMVLECSKEATCKFS